MESVERYDFSVGWNGPVWRAKNYDFSEGKVSLEIEASLGLHDRRCSEVLGKVLRSLGVPGIYELNA